MINLQAEYPLRLQAEIKLFCTKNNLEIKNCKNVGDNDLYDFFGNTDTLFKLNKYVEKIKKDVSIKIIEKILEKNPILDNFSMIVASSNDDVIGNDNKLLWHLPNDLKRFKKLTENKMIIMGRNTYDSLPNGALPQRLNIVLCNDDEEFLNKTDEIKYKNTGLIKLDSINKAMNFVNNYEHEPSMKNITTDEVFIIGGGKIYELFMPIVKKLYLTKVDVDIDGDTKIDISGYDWKPIHGENHLKDEKHKYNYKFLTYEKSN